MTFIVTHTQNHLGCFTLNPDGTMTQRALVDTGPQELTPTELATMGLQMASQFGWTLNGSPARPELPEARVPWNKGKKLGPEYSEVRRQAALKGIRASTGGNSPYTGTHSRIAHPEDPKPVERKRIIFSYLLEHPDSTVWDIIQSVGLEATHARKTRWMNYLWEMKTAGLVYRSSTQSVRNGKQSTSNRAGWTLTRLGDIRARELAGPIAEPMDMGVGSMPEASTLEASEEDTASHDQY